MITGAKNASFISATVIKITTMKRFIKRKNGPQAPQQLTHCISLRYNACFPAESGIFRGVLYKIDCACIFKAGESPLAGSGDRRIK
jgi:hypothetical protein